MDRGQGSHPVDTANHKDMGPAWQGWQTGSLDTTMVQGKPGLLCLAFPCSLTGAPCPVAQRSRDPAQDPLPLKGQSQVESHGWKGDSSQAGCGAPGGREP